LAKFSAFVRKVVATALFVVTLSVLPFGALAPDYEVAYLVVADNHSMPQATEKTVIVKEEPLAVGGAVPTTHVVQRGETLSCVAARYRLTARQLQTFNAITNPHLIRPGQVLLLAKVTPPERQHRVQNGENLWVIASRFDVTVASIIDQNNLVNPNQLRIGQVLSIPRATAVERPSRSSTNLVAMIWPVRGRITSPFGPRWGGKHTGLDIGAPTGTNIKAVRAGRVVLAGWWGGYGKSVMIDHGGGLQTLYAHASRILVRNGDRVLQGQTIARIGSTGNSTGPHLHFEVRQNDYFRDPLNFLPAR